MGKRYDKSFKINVTNQVLEQNRRIIDVAKEHDILPQTLHKWVQVIKVNGKFPGSGIKSDQHYIRKLERENLILKKARYIENTTIAAFEFIHKHKNEFAVSTMCKLLNVSTSGYYKWNQSFKSDQDRRRSFLTRKVKEIYIDYNTKIGSPKITSILKQKGIVVSQSMVSSILKDNKKIWGTSYTAYKNELKLAIDDNTGQVTLDYPYKDNLWDRNNNKYYHQTLASQTIKDFILPKPLSNIKKYDIHGEHIVTDFKDTDNLLIKGDNLQVLHTLKLRYAQKVKLIYIDPPYNTKNNSLSYQDSFSHANYLVFLKNRLDIAKELLRSNGSIFIHCNDKEQAYIKVLCDEIFGRENFLTQIIWQRGKNQQNRSQIANVKDYIIVYAKNKSKLAFNTFPVKKDTLKKYKYQDSKGTFRIDKIASKDGYYNYDIISEQGSKLLRGKWIFPERTFQRLLRNNHVYWAQESGVPYKKVYLNRKKGQIPPDLWSGKDYGSIRQASAELKALKCGTFTFPKPELLLYNIINIATNKEDLVLDFFLGSGTTAAVAHKMNRQYIGVEESADTICLVKERLQRVIAGEQGGISEKVKWDGGDSFISFTVKN